MREEYTIPALKCKITSLSAAKPNPHEEIVIERIRMWLNAEIGLSGMALDKKLRTRYTALVSHCFPDLSVDDLFFATVFMYYFFEIDDFAEDFTISAAVLKDVNQQQLDLFLGKDGSGFGNSSIFEKITLSFNKMLFDVKKSRDMDPFIYAMGRYFQSLEIQKAVINNQSVLSNEEFMGLRHKTGGVEQLLYLGVCLEGYPMLDSEYREIESLVFLGDQSILCANDLFSAAKEQEDSVTFPFCNLIGHKILREAKDEATARQEVLDLTNSGCDQYLEKKAHHGSMSLVQTRALKCLENLMGANIVWSIKSGRYNINFKLSLTEEDLNFGVSFDTRKIIVNTHNQQDQAKIQGYLLCLTTEKINPLYEVACTENREWVRRFKLFNGLEEKLAQADLESLVSRCFFDKTDVDLLKHAMRLISWVTTLDDIVDEDWRSLQRSFNAEQLTGVFRVFFQALTGALSVDFDCAAPAFCKFPKMASLVKSATDIHDGLVVLGLDLTLFYAEFERLLLKELVQEFRVRTEGLKQTLKEYGALRKVVVFSYVFFELGLAFKEFSAEHPLRQDPYFVKFYHTASKATFLSNDIFSLVKEVSVEDSGYIFSRAAETGESLQESFNQLVVRYNESIKKLILIHRVLSQRDDVLQDMTAQHGLAVLMNCVQGILEWSIKTKRYVIEPMTQRVESRLSPDTYFLKHSFFDTSKLDKAYAERRALNRVEVMKQKSLYL